MNEFLSSLKSDLMDRRMLPLLALLGVALLAALAYAVLGGGAGSTPKPTAAIAPIAPGPTGPSLPVSQAPTNPHAAVSETTEGHRYQHHSGAHNPFAPIASAAKTTGSSAAAPSGAGSTSGAAPSTSSSTPSSPSSSGSGGSTGSGSSGGGTTPSEPPAEPAPTKPHKPKVVYAVDVIYGIAPPSPAQLSQLTPYTDLKRLEPLPSATNPRLIYAGVDASGKNALFTLTGEAILKGQGSCVPRPTQCEALALAVGQSEEFGYLEENGITVVYELKVVSITKRKASSATAARLNRSNHAGQALMRRLAPSFLRHLHFSSARGVLVYVTHHRR
jgi:hypothetical protein